MHILLIHQAFASLNEAGGTRHYEIARYFVKHGHQVTIVTSPVSYLTGKTRTGRMHWQEKETPEPGITLLRAYTYPALHRSFFHRLLSYVSFMLSSLFIGLGVKNVDAVWGTSPPIFQGWTAWLIARLKRVPFLFEVRDLWPEFAIAIGVLKSKLLIQLSFWLESFLYRHADQMVINSPGFLPFVQARGAKNVALIPNGVDPDMFDPSLDGRSFRQVHDLQQNFIILYAGAHGISNDLEVVLSAAKITLSNSEISYLFVGDGKEKSALEEFAKKNGLSNVLFLPPVAKNGMKEVVSAADVCLAILKPLEMYKTTYPNKVFDYMAAGRPVVLAIDGVIRDVVETANGGIFVQPGNAEDLAAAIMKLYTDRKGARQLGQNGREYVIKHFDRQELADRFELLFQSLLKK